MAFHLTAVGLFSTLALFPLSASASIFSLLSTKAEAGTLPDVATGTVQNSQKMPDILAANIGPGALDDSTPATDVDISNGGALTPAIGPVGNAADVASIPDNGGQISVYVVRQGDTLGSIAAMFGVTKATIIAANNMTGSTVKPGQSLVILPTSGQLYTVAKGDTIASIAKKFKVSVTDIEEWNDLGPNDTVSVGDPLMIPDDSFTSIPSSGKPSPSKGTSKGSSSGGKVTVSFSPGNSLDLDSFFIRPLQGGIETQGLHGARHTGIDIGAQRGTPILAAASGTVIVAATSGYNTGYGNYVVIQHEINGHSLQTLYAHMSKVLVNVGETVSQGQNIGLVGSTGRSTGSHLHFEVNGAKNPMVNPGFGL